MKKEKRGFYSFGLNNLVICQQASGVD